LLDQAKATESALRAEMPRSRFVHLATHGFFAGRKFRSVLQRGDDDIDNTQGFSGASDDPQLLARRNPLVLSGVVLAGANTPPATNQWGAPTGDDGILTAEEVVDLDPHNTEMVVLSACETGLGEVAGGEGVFGLQRAFHLAGARTVVASQWKVDDAATRVLMELFYRNLWEAKMGKLEALRQAQLAMIAHYSPREGRLRGAGPVVHVTPKDLVDARRQSKTGLLPPFHWAGFALSGDWR
jgi:CHAT domain-containing protein